MERPTQRYRDVASLFRDCARAEGQEPVPAPATAEEVSVAERALGCLLPDSYRWFQLEFGDVAHGPLDIYTVKGLEPPALNIVGINLDARREGYPPLPSRLIAFSDNGAGDYCCFDMSAPERGECPVVWWDHEGHDAQQPERAGSSFLDWLAAELRERAAEERWSSLSRVASRARAISSFAREVWKARQRLLLFAVLTVLPGSISETTPAAAQTPAGAQTTQGSAVPSVNPLLTESPLPYHLPPFEQITDEHFAPAFALGMAENLKEVEAIANNPAPATFDNTIVALERSGELLSRASRAFGILASANTNPNLQQLETVMAPKFAAHGDAIVLNAALFARMRTLYDGRSALKIDAESMRLLELYYKDFVRAGARLAEADKVKLRAMNAELATLSTEFGQNVLKDTNASSVIVNTRAELAGLSEAAITAAANAAGETGRFALRLTNTTGQPLLALVENRAVRERVMRASLGRGNRGGEFDNRAIVARIARLRAERATLLGYANHAAFQLEEQTARSVETVNALLAQLAPPAVANARREAADLQAIVDAERGGFTIAAHDWDFYSEKVRKARYAFDESQLRPYYELRRVLVDGVFHAAERLYGVTFKERRDLKGFSPDMFVFEVFNEDGSPLALFLADFYARPNKRGGAWATAYVPQSGLTGDKAVIGNHLNIPKPPDGEPTLLTHDEVRTMFHEFGHALHGMFRTVKYPRVGSVPRDFVEYPSQVNEMWATWPEILRNYAKHYQTGAPIPQELLDKVDAARKFNQGYATTELVGANAIDQAWHQLGPAAVPTAEGAMAFESAALKTLGVDFAPVPPRYRSTYFLHIFNGGYSAGYYSYFWSEVLDADSVEWFKSHGGLTRANGDHFRATLLSRGHSREAMELFRNFTGHDPDIKPLLVRRGLDQPAAKPPQ